VWQAANNLILFQGRQEKLGGIGPTRVLERNRCDRQTSRLDPYFLFTRLTLNVWKRFVMTRRMKERRKKKRLVSKREMKATNLRGRHAHSVRDHTINSERRLNGRATKPKGREVGARIGGLGGETYHRRPGRYCSGGECESIQATEIEV